MKGKLLLPLLLALISCSISAQSFEKVEEYILNIPPKEDSSIPKLSAYLSRIGKSDSAKVKAIYMWIAHNIAYDVKQLDKITSSGKLRTERNPTQVPEYVLKTRKAVCEGYANLFKELCAQAKIKAVVVGGSCRVNEEMADLSHAWNVVLANGKWKLLDVTWSAGYLDAKNKYTKKFSSEFYFPDPDQFNLSHYPSDPIWQLTDNPVTHIGFRSGKFTKTTGAFSYLDSINNHFRLDSITAVEKSFRRTLQFDPDDDEARMGISFLYLKRGNDLARKVIMDLNKYIEIRNSQFKGVKDGAALVTKLIGFEEELKKAVELIKLADSKDALNKENIKQARASINENLDFLKSEKIFLTKHFNLD